MNNMRLFVWMALFAVGFLLWQAWQTDYHQPKPDAAAIAEDTSAQPDSTPAAGDIPDVGSAPAATSSVEAATDNAAIPTQNSATAAPERIITVATDVLSLRIDTRGGTLRSADLLKYAQEANKPQPVVRLLDDTAGTWFVAQSGLRASRGAAPTHETVFTAERDHYELAAGSDQLEVPLTWTDVSGVSVTKTYSFRRGEYLVRQRQTVTNNAGL